MLCCFQVCLCVCVCVCTRARASLPTLCNPMDCSPTGSTASGDSPGMNTEWVAMPSSRGSSQARDLMRISYVCCIGRQVFLWLAPPGKSIFRCTTKKIAYAYTYIHSSLDSIPIWVILEYWVPFAIQFLITIVCLFVCFFKYTEACIYWGKLPR